MLEEWGQNYSYFHSFPALLFPCPKPHRECPELAHERLARFLLSKGYRVIAPRPGT
jgi:hypothetical protein